uniref:Cadherin-5 n=1 Tax=Latimeria chalumnae TaxID=7897 RepID=H3ASY9_LATCH
VTVATHRMDKFFLHLIQVVFCINIALADEENTISVLSISKSSNTHGQRVKRQWEWNQLYAVEENKKEIPHLLGKIKSSITSSNAKYVLEGEGANSIFRVEPQNGDVYAWKRLDREEKSEYKLTALIVDRNTGKKLDEPSDFTLKIIDINDNAPRFTLEFFNGSVPEMSSRGTSVVRVTAEDADDPTVGAHAEIIYSIHAGSDYFVIENKTGIIRTKLSQLDREEKSSYEVVVEAKDMPGYQGGLSSTATVIIKLTDINDNPPVFRQGNYSFNVLETIQVKSEVGRIKAEDADEPWNSNTKYDFIERAITDTFHIKTDANTKEGVITLKKPLDFETRKEYSFIVEATDPSINLQFIHGKPTKTRTTVNIKVLDADEPPVFTAPFYRFEAYEDAPLRTVLGFVSAKDPDATRNSVRYSLGRSTDREPFFQVLSNGNILSVKPFDRETNAWHNITVTANEIAPNGQKSDVTVTIKILDRNDNPPELATNPEINICENVAEGTVIQTISAVDKDEMAPGVNFGFSLSKEENNFTLKDNQDNTAEIIIKRAGFSHQEHTRYFLPVIITDNGTPLLSSTTTLSITVCSCTAEGKHIKCQRFAAATMGISVHALIAIFLCIVTIIVITLLIALRRKQKKNAFTGLGKDGDINEQLVRYDEEGGGEMDTNSYDVSVLRSVRKNGARPREEIDVRPCLYAQVKKPAANGEMAVMIEVKKDEADNDRDGIPYDTLHIYGYEGSDSLAGSLSSLETGSSDSEQDYDFLNDWGPRFKTLAELYG